MAPVKNSAGGVTGMVQLEALKARGLAVGAQEV